MNAPGIHETRTRRRGTSRSRATLTAGLVSARIEIVREYNTYFRMTLVHTTADPRHLQISE